MNRRPSLASLLGLARSLLMYYAVPGRARAWRRFYRRYVAPGDLCFDVGAHVGNRTGALLSLGARVIALEPQPLLAQTISRIYSKSPRLAVVRQAVGREQGRGQMRVSSRAPTVSTMSTAWINQVTKEPSFSKLNWDRRQAVEVTTIDALIARFGLPVFCKLDVEGYELEALQGLSQPIRYISFEYIPVVIRQASSCVHRLMEIGDYQFNLIEGEYPKLALAEWVSAARLSEHLRAKSPRRPGEILAALKD